MHGLGDKLIYLRKQCGYTQEYLAEYLNINRTSISNYEKEINEPSLDTLVKLADLYHVSLDWLLGRTRHKYNFALENETNIEAIMDIYKTLKKYKIEK